MSIFIKLNNASTLLSPIFRGLWNLIDGKIRKHSKSDVQIGTGKMHFARARTKSRQE